MVNSIIEGLCNFISSCPLFAEYGIGANWKADDPDSAGVIEDNTDTVSEYLSGATLKEMHASVYLGALSDADILRLNNSAFLRSIQLWVRKQDTAGNYPELPEGCTAQSITADEGTPFEYDSDDGKKCTYQIPITLEYMEEIL